MADVITLRDVAAEGRRADVTVRDGIIEAIRPHGAQPTPRHIVIDGHGGTLLPGLHDHHLHLLAMAAALDSVDCAAITSRDAFVSAVRARQGVAVRAVGYHESLAGPLDRYHLDEVERQRPLRVQHRSGGLWVLNSVAIEAVAESAGDAPGIERDADGTPTGRLWRADHLVRAAFAVTPPRLRAVGELLSRHGITSVTDATPDLDSAAIGLLKRAQASGELPQSLTLLGAPDSFVPTTGVQAGPRKILLHDHDLPDAATLAIRIGEAHALGRPVAIHCVTSDSLALTLGVLSTVGTLHGDRLEHGSIVPPAMIEMLASSGLTVVTQPDFVRSRGDDYLRDVPLAEHEWLYPYGSLRAQGVPVVASSDAPFGAIDPWAAMRSAVERRTVNGATIALHEAVDAGTALTGYLTNPLAPGGRERRVTVGAPADLCLLRRGIAEALDSDRPVRLTMIAGRVEFASD